MGGNNISLPLIEDGFSVVESGNFVVLDAPDCGIQVRKHDESNLLVVIAKNVSVKLEKIHCFVNLKE